MNRNYKISVNWSNSGNAFIADVPELSGCMALGKSFMEALENVEMVIEEWIISASTHGIPVPPPKQVLSLD